MVEMLFVQRTEQPGLGQSNIAVSSANYLKMTQMKQSDGKYIERKGENNAFR